MGRTEFHNVGDFWNDPRRWDGVDPHKEFFWMVRRPDVIDVSPPPAKPPVALSPYTNVAPDQSHLAALQQAMNSCHPLQGVVQGQWQQVLHNNPQGIFGALFG